MEHTCFYWQHHELGPVLGIGLANELKLELQFDQTQVQDFFTANHGNYIFGHLSYELKNFLFRFKMWNLSEVILSSS
jgi:hypothetical protein